LTARISKPEARPPGLFFRPEDRTMSQHRKIKISPESLPTRGPLGLLALVWLLLDRFHAPDIAFGAFYAIAVLMLLGFGYAYFTEQYTPVEGFAGS
jgi:hypothetical protein